MICLPLVVLFDFDLSASGLVASGTLNQWGFAVPTVRPPGSGTESVWSTSPAGDTLNDTEEFLELPLPALTTAERPVLVVEHATMLGAGDLARFELDTGSGFAAVAPIHGYPSPGAFQGDSGGYLTTGVDLTEVPPGSRFRFHFTADASGSGPGWFIRSLRIEDGDPIPPIVELRVTPGDTDDLAGPYEVEVEVDEDVSVERAEVVWSVGGVESRGLMQPDGDRWTAGIPGVGAGSVVSWHVEVEDCSVTVATAEQDFRVFLPAPTDLSGPGQPHTVARSVTLDWEAPETQVPVLGYELTELSSGHTVTTASTTAQVHLEPGWDQRFVVRAEYAAGWGDASEELELDVEVPELVRIEPSEVYPGDRVWVSLEGRSLYLLEGVSTLAFGDLSSAAATALDLTVLDVDRARALVEIPTAAPAGTQDVVLTGTRGSFRFSDQFTVLDAADAPRITSVSPDTIVQGERVDLVINASRPFGEPVEITADEELILGGDPVVDGDRLVLPLGVLGNARAGVHTLVIDDGTRAFEVTIEVEEYRYQGRGNCSSVGSLWSGSGGGLAILLGWIIMRPRSRGSWRSLP